MFRRKGVWWTCIRHNGRKIQKSLETPDRKLAQAIEAKIRADIAEGKFFEKETGHHKTFSDMIKRFMAEHSPTVSRNMQLRYRGCLKNLNPFFQNFSLDQITAKEITRYKVERRKEAKPATVNRELAMLSKAFNLVVDEWEWLSQKPFKKIPKEKEDNERDRWLTLEEENRLLSACPEWLREIVVFDLNTGMRQEELLSIEWPWIDIFRRLVIIPGVFSKNGKPRTIPLNKMALEILTGKAKVRSISCKKVFLSQAGTKIDSGNLRRAFYDALEKAGIENFTFHDLRHTFATRLAQGGVDLYKISKLLGHKDIRTTQRYSHHSPESLRGGVDILENPTNFDYILTTLEKKGASPIGLTP